METTYQAGEETLRAYLPATLVEHWARRPEQPPLWGTWLTGSLMFCDISGFTAMSENLAKVGKEGAELMAAVLNRFFERMLAIADGWGGVQMKFGGDAMLLLFSDDRHAERAAAAGLEMQAAMADFRRVSVRDEMYRLRMRVAIHSGRFYGASVGQPDGMLHYLLVGPDVNRTAGIEGAGEPGQVVVSAEAARQIDSGTRLVPKNGVWRVSRMQQPPRPAPRQQMPAPSSALRHYLLPPLAAPLLAGQMPSFSGEHRRVTAVFINLLGVSTLLETEGEAQALAQADAYVKMVIEAVERHGGFLAASDLAHEGDKLICLFGAPLFVEHEERGALRAVVELDRALRSSGLKLKHRIGVSSGSVFAGEIGSSRRREYTVIGDSVNLAARLMAASRPGQILVSKPTIERAGDGFDLQRMRPLRVKGKAAPVAVFRLLDARGEHKTERQPQAATALVGREQELAALLRLSRQVTTRRRARWAYLWGEPGIGKSRLTQELATGLLASGWQEIVASCQLHTWHTPFAPWREPLRALLGVSSDEAPEEVWQRLHAAIERAAPQLVDFAPLLGELLSLPLPDSVAISSLDPKEHRRQLTSLVVSLLAAAAKERPLLLLFEDAHWADEPSLELLAAVLSQGVPVMVVATSREPSPAGDFSAAGEPVSIHLRELPPEAARALVASTSGLDAQLLEKIVARAQGNPLFLQEIARIGLVRGETIPETINDVILTRLDRLPPEEKRVLRLASVIGPSFDLQALYALAGNTLEPARVNAALAQLAELGFTRSDERGPASYAFSHILTREVAYETLPYAQRRQLHRHVGQHIEQQDSARLEAVCELLLHHYEMAAETAKIVRYAAMSGERAAAVFATGEALTYYQRSLSALAELKGFESDRSLVLERLGDCLETTGQHTKAAKAFADALEDWRSSRRRPRLLAARDSLRTREAGLCLKTAVSLERADDEDGALHWLEDALAALPGRAPQVTAQVYAAKSLALFRKGLYEEAVSWGRRGVALARRSRDLRQLAYTHHILSNSHQELGRLHRSLQNDRLAVRYYHELGDLPGQARSNGNLAVSYQTLGVLDAALYHYEVGLKASERLGNAAVAAQLRSNIGEVLLMLGRVEAAVAQFQQVLAAYREGRCRAFVAGVTEVFLARCGLRSEDVDGAARHLRRGIRLLKGAGAQGLLTEALLVKLEWRLAAGDALNARRECRRALADARALEAKVLEARGERLLGRAEAALGDPERARAHFRASISIARHAGASYDEALSLLSLGRMLLASPATRRQGGRPLRRAIGILSRMGAALDLAEAQTLLENSLPAPVAAAAS